MAAFKTNFQSLVPFSMAMAAFTTIRPSDIPFKNPFVSVVKFVRRQGFWCLTSALMVPNRVNC